MSASILSPDFKEQPYWWDALPAAIQEAALPSVPGQADVVIVGGGLTGVSAAWELAKGGRHVVVLDAIEPGQGASSRNAGMLGRHCLLPFRPMVDMYGLQTVRAYYDELDEAFRSASQRIADEKIECDFRVCGRFIGAFSRAHHENLVKEYEARVRDIKEEPPQIIPPGERVELASTQYTGGIYLKNYANIQPARYHYGMRQLAEKAGATVIGHTPVTALVRDRQDFVIHTPRGAIRARDVIVATNGYTGKVTPWFAQRISPLNAYMVATEPLPDGIAKSLLGIRCAYTDTRTNPNTLQLSPDGKRLLVGGRTGRVHKSLPQLAEHLHRDMLTHFPQLEGVKMSHAWTGRCAVTHEKVPQTGVHEGVHYALGFCYAGITVGPHLGIKVAKRILGAADSKTIFETFNFEKTPWLQRQPWAISIYMAQHVGHDRHHYEDARPH